MKSIALFIVVLLSCTTLLSQESKIVWGASTFYSNPPKQNTSLLSAELLLGYRFNDCFTGIININTSSSSSIFAESHNNISTSYGIDLDYRVFNTENYFIYLRGGVDSNLFENNNKYVCYKGGAYIATGRFPIKPIWGMSLRYYDLISKERKGLLIPCLSMGFLIQVSK